MKCYLFTREDEILSVSKCKTMTKYSHPNFATFDQTFVNSRTNIPFMNIAQTRTIVLLLLNSASFCTKKSLFLSFKAYDKLQYNSFQPNCHIFAKSTVMLPTTRNTLLGNY